MMLKWILNSGVNFWTFSLYVGKQIAMKEKVMMILFSSCASRYVFEDDMNSEILAVLLETLRIMKD